MPILLDIHFLANCYCPGDPYQLFGYNTAKNRYERFVDCYMDIDFIGYDNTSVSKLCLQDGFTSSAITSAMKHDFIRSIIYMLHPI
jgi:hypothetical protein